MTVKPYTMLKQEHTFKTKQATLKNHQHYPAIMLVDRHNFFPKAFVTVEQTWAMNRSIILSYTF